jgi:hypothetical protein
MVIFNALMSATVVSSRMYLANTDREVSKVLRSLHVLLALEREAVKQSGQNKRREQHHRSAPEKKMKDDPLKRGPVLSATYRKCSPQRLTYILTRPPFTS